MVGSLCGGPRDIEENLKIKFKLRRRKHFADSLRKGGKLLKNEWHRVCGARRLKRCIRRLTLQVVCKISVTLVKAKAPLSPQPTVSLSMMRLN